MENTGDRKGKAEVKLKSRKGWGRVEKWGEEQLTLGVSENPHGNLLSKLTLCVFVCVFM